MKTTRVKGYAKINLTLEVEGRLPDGYHHLNTVMHSISLYDSVRLTLRDDGLVNLHCNLPYVPTDKRNIACSSAALFFNTVGRCPGVDIDLDKRIPVGAGLGGGSADGGAVLIGLNNLLGKPLKPVELLRLGASLGADIPFTMTGGAALATGIGDILTPCTTLPPCYIVLCKPKFGVSTKAAFQSLTEDNFTSLNKSQAMVKGLNSGNICEISRLLFNSFETPVAQGKPQILKIKNKLLECGALGALMSGSGSTVYGIFSNLQKAQRAQRNLRRHCGDTFLVKPVNEI